MTRATRLGAAVLLSLAAVLLLARGAEAHAGLTDSNPKDGAILQTAPDAVTLSFSEPPDPDLSKVDVLDGTGAPVETGPLDEGPEPMQLTVPLPDDLPDGIYTVAWSVVSEADSHPTASAFAFGVGVSSDAKPAPSVAVPRTPQPSPLSVVGRVALYSGLALLVGAAAVGLWAFGGNLPARRPLLLVAGALTAAGAVAMALAAVGALDVSLGDLLPSSAGRPYVWLLTAAIGSAALACLAAFTRARATLAAAGISAALAMLARAMGGHAAAAPTPWPQELAQFAHFLAIGVWVGGFVPVLLVLRAGRGGEAPVAKVRRYSTMAGVALAIVVVTGTVRSISEAGGISSALRLVTDTGYGTMLAIKVGLAVTLIALGAVNRYRAIPRLRTGEGTGEGLLARVMSVEVAAALGIFVLTGTLTGLSPEIPRRASPPVPMAVTVTASDFATTLRLTLTASPGTPGPNSFEVTLEGYDSGAPVGATRVALRFEPVGRPDVGRTTLEFDEAEPGTWTGSGTQLSFGGIWSVTALVASAAEATEITLSLATGLPDQQLAVSRQEGLPAIYTFTLDGGNRLQTYILPGAPGPNELHITAFGPDGEELPLEGLAALATSDGGSDEVLDASRLTAGHFSAAAELVAGGYRFDVAATARNGTILQASFEEAI